MQLTEQELLLEYNRLTNSILDECDWKTHFTGEEVCGLVHNILSRDENQLNVTPQELHKIYSNQVSNLNLSDEEWRTQYGVPEIIHMIYEILTDLNDVNLPTP
jgi:hypothetical protein